MATHIQLTPQIPSPPGQPISGRMAVPTQKLKAVPFFFRLGVKHGIVLTALVIMAMTVITSQQLSKTLQEMERRSEGKARAIVNTLSPMVRENLNNPGKLKELFNSLTAKMEDLEYVQIVDVNGRVIVASDIRPGQWPAPLEPGWIFLLGKKEHLDRRAAAIAWKMSRESNPKKGVDAFIALLENSEKATTEEIQKAHHLRVGLNFEDILDSQTPRVIREMIVFTLIAAFVMVLGLLILLTHILRPLKQLHLGLQAVASGNLEYEVPVHSQDEVGRVLQAFNATNARLRAAFEQIEALATRDPLTNIPNRRVFDERLASESARSRRYGHPFGLIILDLDNFKRINDRYGHPTGDEVLKYVSKTIEANVRETDVPARIGGEEFAVILPESNSTEVLGVAEKLRTAIAETSLPAGNGSGDIIRVTISGGAACSAGHLVTPESMIAAADAALYKSKGEGRNRTTMATRIAGQTNVVLKKIEDQDKFRT